MSVSDFLGGPEDAVRLEIEGQTIAIAESYQVHRAVFSRQPCSFTLKFGHGGVAADLLRRFKPRDAFSLSVAGNLAFTGNLDDVDAESDGNGTSVTFTGRDDLARLHDAYVDAERAFSNVTYEELLFKALTICKYEGFSIVKDDEASKKIAAGVSALPKPVATVLPNETTPAGAAVSGTSKAIRCKPPNRWFERLKVEYDRAGLVLWAATDQTFILSVPGAEQAPLFRIIRQNHVESTDRSAVNVERGTYRNATSQRFSRCKVFARGGGGKQGRTTATAVAEDEGMLALGFDRDLVVRDAKCTTHDEAVKLAERKLADVNRRAVNITYRIAGHTMPVIGSGQRAVPVPNLCADIQDDLLGVHRVAYLESVMYGRDNGEGTYTDLTFMRTEDLLFGGEPE